MKIMDVMKMVCSMTGYGKAERIAFGYKLWLEIRSVNHRYREISVHIPKGWLRYESLLKKGIQDQVQRGKVDAYLTLEPLEEVLHTIDWHSAEHIVALLREMQKRFGLREEMGVQDLLQFPELFQHEPDMNLDWGPVLQELVEEATGVLIQMRRQEGAAMEEDLKRRNRELLAQVENMALQAPEVSRRVEEKLRQRLHQLTKQVRVDEERLVTEVAYYAERAGIDEELTRLRSHIHQLNAALHGDTPAGKKLDFLLQEIQREVNTVGAKAQDSLLSQRVVFCKSEIEKMREQVQNIE